MSEGLLVTHCSPTLAGIKPGSMFSCSYETNQELLDYVRHANSMLGPKGIRVLILRYGNGRALLYVFRPKDVSRMLEDQKCADLLRSMGYDNLKIGPCLCLLMERIRYQKTFPHEVGLFLGYPAEDVAGFIRNSAGNQKCGGCWKVYGDEESARKIFASYKRCTSIYCRLWEQGSSVERLTVAG